jgi:hypothetical protein
MLVFPADKRIEVSSPQNEVNIAKCNNPDYSLRIVADT